MRSNPTQGEYAFETKLRELGFKGRYVSQFVMLPYIFDFVLPELKLLVEIDGNVHDTLENQERDRKKTSLALSKGYKVLRLRNSEVKDVTLQTILDAVV
jgi:very-short-patch-repair endonuclease